MSLESEKRVKKLVSVSATSTSMTGTREKAVKNAETGKTTKAVETAKAIKTAGADKDGKERKSEYLENLARVPCIRYPITF